MNVPQKLSLIALIMAIAALVACSNGGGSAPGNIEGFVLEDASYMTAMDINGLLNAVDAPSAAAGSLGFSSYAEDFEDALDDWRDQWEDDDTSLGTTLDEVTDFMLVGYDGGGYMVVKGDFDFADIRSELEDQDYDDGTYREREIWEKDDYDAVALFDASGVFVLSNRDSVREVIKAVQRGEGFANSENSGLIGVRDKAGKGLMFLGFNDCSNAFGVAARIDASGVNNCDAIGMAITDGNEDETEISAAFLFSSERRAESGMDDIEDSIEDDDNLDADIEEIKVDGKFITFKLTIYE